ncbi:MAG: hypothetical protein C0402_09715 [Thermodesulfovibrio sp.]|nr:hypothetical protein [Thermodesulfovibrio sp.]
MTKIRINPGACGFEAMVELKQKDKNTVTVSISSECKMVEKLGQELNELAMMDAFRHLLGNPVYVKGAACLKHAACPVPSGILKALEVEAGFNVPKDVTMTFIKENSETEEKQE